MLLLIKTIKEKRIISKKQRFKDLELKGDNR